MHKGLITNHYILIFICIFTFAFSENQLNSDVKKDGYWESKYSNGILKSRIKFELGIPIGQAERYKEDGRISIIYNFIKGDTLCDVLIYNEDGETIFSKGKYSFKKKIGKWQFFRENRLYKEMNFKNDTIQGTEITFFPDGTTNATCIYQNGKKQGVSWVYSEKGFVMFKRIYKNGMLDGDYEEYNAQNVLLVKGLYLRGKKDGNWSYFDNTGILKFTLQYKEGKSIDSQKEKEVEEYFYRNMPKIDEKDVLNEEDLYGDPTKLKFNR